MRYNDFKIVENSFVAEEEQSDIAQSLDYIEDMAEQDPKALEFARQGIAKLRDYVNKIKAKVKQVPQTEDASSAAMVTDLRTQIAQLENDIAEICREMGDACNKYVANMRNFLSSLEKKLEALIGASKGEGKEEAEKEFFEWFNNLSKILNALGKKAQGYTELSEEDLAAMTAKQRAGAKKVAVNAENFANELGNSLRSLFLDVLFTDQGADIHISRQDVTEFLQESLKGTVINNEQLVAQDKGNIDNFVNPAYKKVYDAISGRLVPLKPPASGGANIGPGELALAMCGNPANKAEKGDIKVGNDMYEIKAGAGSVGGRFNSDQATTAFGGWNTWDKGLKDIAGDELVVRDKNQKGKPLSLYNWNDKGIDALNSQVLKPYSTKEDTLNKLLIPTFSKIIKNHKEVPGFVEDLEAMINPDGTINKETYMKHYASILYKSYNLADGVTNIMIIDTASRDYAIIRHSEGDISGDLMNKLGDTIRTAGGFNWNDNHQKASPQFVIKR